MFQKWACRFFLEFRIINSKFTTQNSHSQQLYMKKCFLVIIILISCIVSNNSFSQSGFSWNRVVFGGNFGAGFSSTQSAVAISPTVGYRVTEKLTLGTGFIYQYNRYKFSNFDFKFSNYGSKLFGTYQLNDFLILHSEYESLNLEYITYNSAGIPDGTKRRNIGSLFVGGGYRQYLSSNSVVDLMILYNLTETLYTPYSNPIIRIGFGIGL